MYLFLNVILISYIIFIFTASLTFLILIKNVQEIS